eukprot:g4760.t1
MSNNVGALLALLENGAEVDKEDDWGYTALYYATSNYEGDARVVHILVGQWKANRKHPYLDDKHKKCIAKAMVSFSEGTKITIETLNKGYDSSSRRDKGRGRASGGSKSSFRPSNNTTSGGGRSSVGGLSSTTTSPKSKKIRQKDAICSALEAIESSSMLRLREALSDVSQASARDPKSGRSLLHVAIKSRFLKGARHLLDRGADIDATSPKDDNRSALHFAAMNNDVDAIRLLLDNGASATLETLKGGRMPLHDAVYAGNVKATRVLLTCSKEAKNQVDGGNRCSSPLILAIENGYEDVVRALLEHGANGLARRPKDGKSALEIARNVRGSSFANVIQQSLDAHNFAEDKKRALEKWKGTRTSFRSRALRGEIVFKRSDADAENLSPKLIDAVRAGTFDILGNDYFRSQAESEPSANVFLSIAYDRVMPKYCDLVDVTEPLKVLESAKASPNELDPRYWLAHARVAMHRNENALAAALLERFKKHCPNMCALRDSTDDKGWLTALDQNALKPPQRSYEASHGGRGTSGAGGASSKEGPPAATTDDPTSVESQWAELKKSLTKEQIVPMETGYPKDKVCGLMQLTGLNAVKEKALEIYAEVLADAKIRKRKRGAKNTSSSTSSLNFAFLGNPGTGKTTVARIFARLLEQAGARPGHKFVQMTAGEAIRKGADTFATIIEGLIGGKKGVGPPPEYLRRGMKVEVLKKSGKTEKWWPGKVIAVRKDKNQVDVLYTDGTEDTDLAQNDSKKVRALGTVKEAGGVLFMDEAYDLDPKNNPVGRAILNEIMSVAEDYRDCLTIILAGYPKDIEEKLYAFNAGIASRFVNVHFEDFNEAQLASIWNDLLKKNGWAVEEPKVSAVVARRLARRIKTPNFGNARSVRKLFESAVKRGKLRYLRNKKDGAQPILTMEDVIGKEPSESSIPALKRAMDDLRAQVGLAKVKESVYRLVDVAKANYEKELQGEEVTDVALNRLFVGNPGTGKTTVAKIYGRILTALGLLSKGEVVSKTASDFKGDVVGASEQQTKAIIEQAQGCVLLIDEAYGLDDNLYGKQALDTIVEKVSNEAGGDIAVIMMGYKPQIEKMLREQNPGLSRRFNPAFAFEFEDFKNGELLEIMTRYCRKQNIRVSIDVKMEAVKHLGKRRALPNFGNAGALISLVNEAKVRMEARCHRDKSSSERHELSVDDIFGDENPTGRDPMAVLEELTEIPGSKGRPSFKERLRRLGRQIAVRKRDGSSMDGLVGHYIFTGAPGTGKTTVARKFGEILYGYG